MQNDVHGPTGAVFKTSKISSEWRVLAEFRALQSKKWVGCKAVYTANWGARRPKLARSSITEVLYAGFPAYRWGSLHESAFQIQCMYTVHGKLDAGRLEAEKTLPERSISRISITSLWIRRACAGSQTITQPHHHLVSALTKGGASSPNKYPFVPYVPPCLLYNCKIPDNDDELCVPTSDPFEEEELARYSQRHETREYSETLITESLRRSGVKRVRRSLLGDNEKQSSLCSICNPGGHSAVASAQARNGEPDLPKGTEDNMRSDPGRFGTAQISTTSSLRSERSKSDLGRSHKLSINIDLLLLHCRKLEQEREEIRAEAIDAHVKYHHIQEDRDKMAEGLRQCKLGLSFFRRKLAAGVGLRLTLTLEYR
ncbi:hypothetical protein R3P38DRAFT_2793120 [Favolaschia claudopus]|uniref:Uncharacterized protein n=1 Tax=Favolaschia claudopus TaxID=2862362 RepID=A0AAW0AEA0_9AGAR